MIWFPLRRAVGGVLSVAFLFTQVLCAHAVESNFWADRSQAARKMRQGPGFDVAAFAGDARKQETFLASLGGTPLQPGAGPEIAFGAYPAGTPLPTPFPAPAGDAGALSKILPILSRHGTLRDVRGPLDPNEKPSAIVVCIQDVHGHRAIQSRIAILLQGLFEAVPGAVLALEGAAGPVDPSPFRRYAAPANAVSASFLANAGLIGGAEEALLRAEHPPRAFGAETPDLYLKNVRAIKEAAPRRADLEASLGKWRAGLRDAKTRFYSPSLLEFDRQRAAHENGALNLGAYVEFLLKKNRTPSLAGLPTIARFLDTYRLEKSLDMESVRRDRASLMEKLVYRLVSADLDSLLQASLAFRGGTFATGPYYAYVKSAVAKAGLSLDRFPHFATYIRYVLAADAIKPEVLWKDVAGLETSTARALCVEPPQWDLYEADRDLGLLAGLVQLSLTTEEWRQYKDRREEAVRLPDRLAGLLGEPPSPRTGWIESLDPFEAFYATAEERNRVLVEGLWSAGSAAGGEPPVVLFVAGGFHSDGVAALLKEKGALVLTVTPKTSDFADNKAPDPFELFVGEKSSLEGMFESPRITLAETLSIGGTIGRSVRADAVRVLGPATGALAERLSNPRGASAELPPGVEEIRLAPDGRSGVAVLGSPGGKLLLAMEGNEERGPFLRKALAKARALLENVPAGPDSLVSVYRRGLSAWEKTKTWSRPARDGIARWTPALSRWGGKALIFIGVTLLVYGASAVLFPADALAYEFAKEGGKVLFSPQSGEHLWGAAKEILRLSGTDHATGAQIWDVIHRIVEANPDIANPAQIAVGHAYTVPSDLLPGAAAVAADAAISAVTGPGGDALRAAAQVAAPSVDLAANVAFPAAALPSASVVASGGATDSFGALSSGLGTLAIFLGNALPYFVGLGLIATIVRAAQWGARNGKFSALRNGMARSSVSARAFFAHFRSRPTAPAGPAALAPIEISAERPGEAASLPVAGAAMPPGMAESVPATAPTEPAVAGVEHVSAPKPHYRRENGRWVLVPEGRPVAPRASAPTEIPAPSTERARPAPAVEPGGSAASESVTGILSSGLPLRGSPAAEGVPGAMEFLTGLGLSLDRFGRDHSLEGGVLTVSRADGKSLRVRLARPENPREARTTEWIEGDVPELLLSMTILDFPRLVQQKIMEHVAAQLAARSSGASEAAAAQTADSLSADHQTLLAQALALRRLGVTTRSLETAAFEARREVSDTEVGEVYNGPSLGLRDEEQYFEGGEVPQIRTLTPEYADNTPRRRVSKTKAVLTEAVARVGVMTEEERHLRFATGLAEMVRDKFDPEHRTVLIDAAEEHSTLYARVFAAHGVAVRWLTTPSSLAGIAHRLAGGGHALGISGTTIYDRHGRTVPPEIQSKIWDRVLPLSEIQWMENLDIARSQNLLTDVAEDLDAPYRASLAEKITPGKARFVVDIRRLTASQREAYQRLLGPAGLNVAARFLTEGDSDALARELRADGSGGLLGLQIHKYGQKLRVLDTGGESVDDWQLALALIDGGRAGDALGVTPWDPETLRSAAERAGMRVEEQGAQRPSKRSSAPLFNGDVLATALAVSGLIDPAHPSLRDRLGEAATPLKKAAVRVAPETARRINQNLKAEGADATGRRLAQRAGQKFLSARVVPINGSNQPLLIVDTSNGRLWVWVDGPDVQMKASGEGARALVRSGRIWAAAQTARTKGFQALVGFALYGAYLLGSLSAVGYLVFVQSGFVFGVMDNVTLLMDGFLGPGAALGAVFSLLAALIITANLFVFADEALFSVVRARLARRFARGEGRRWDIHPLIWEDSRRVMADRAGSRHSRAHMVAAVGKTTEIFKGFKTLPGFLQVFFFLRDVSQARLHANRNSSDRPPWSYFLHTLLLYAIVRPAAMLWGGMYEMGRYARRVLTQRGYVRPGLTDTLSDAEAARRTDAVRGTIAAVYGPSEVAPRVMDRSVIVLPGNVASGEEPLIFLRENGRWVALDKFTHGRDFSHQLDLVIAPEAGTPDARLKALEGDALTFRRSPAPLAQESAGPLPAWLGRMVLADGGAEPRPVSPEKTTRAGRRLMDLFPEFVHHGPGFFTIPNGFGKVQVRVLWSTLADIGNAQLLGPRTAPNGTPEYRLILDPRVMELPEARRRALLNVFRDQLVANAYEPSRLRGRNDRALLDRAGTPEEWRRDLEAAKEGRRTEPLGKAWMSVDPSTGRIEASTESEVFRATQGILLYLQGEGALQTPLVFSLTPGARPRATAALEVLSAHARRTGQPLWTSAEAASQGNVPVFRIKLSEDGLVASKGGEGAPLARTPREIDRLNRALSLEAMEAFREAPDRVVDAFVAPESVRAPPWAAASPAADSQTVSPALPLGLVWAGAAVVGTSVAVALAVFAGLSSPVVLIALQGHFGALIATGMSVIYFLKGIPLLVPLLTAVMPSMALSYLHFRLFHARDKRAVFNQWKKTDKVLAAELSEAVNNEALASYDLFAEKSMDRDVVPSVWADDIVGLGTDGRLQINHRALRIAHGVFFHRFYRAAFLAIRGFSARTISQARAARAAEWLARPWARLRLLLFVQMESQLAWEDRLLAPIRFGSLTLFFQRNSRFFFFFHYGILYPVLLGRLFIQSLGLLLHPSVHQLGETAERLETPAELKGKGLEVLPAVVGRANGVPEIVLADGTTVEVIGWDVKVEKLRQHLDAGDRVVVLAQGTPRDGKVKGYLYVRDEGFRGEGQRWVSLKPQTGAPLFLAFSPAATLPRGPVFLSAYGPALRWAIAASVVLSTAITVVAVALLGVPEMFWSPRAWTAFQQSVSWSTAAPVAARVLTLVGFLAFYKTIIESYKVVFGLHRPGRFRLLRALAVPVFSFLTFLGARLGWAHALGAGEAHFGTATTRALEKSAFVHMTESHTLDGLALGVRHAFGLDLAARINALRVAGGLPILSARDLEEILRPLEDPGQDPRQFVQKLLAVVGRLDASRGEGLARLGVAHLENGMVDIAFRKLTSPDHRFLTSVENIRKSLREMLEEMNRSLDAEVAGALRGRGSFDSAVPAATEAFWGAAGAHLAGNIEANIVRQLETLAHRQTALGPALQRVKSAVADLKAAPGRESSVERLKDVGVALNGFFAELQRTTLVPQPLRRLAMTYRPDFILSLSRLLPAGPSDRDAYSIPAVLKAQEELRVQAQNALQFYRELEGLKGLHKDVYFSKTLQNLMSEAPPKLAGLFEARSLPLLRRLADRTGTGGALSGVESALAAFRSADGEQSGPALSRLTRETENFLERAFGVRRDLLADLPGHPRTELKTASVHFNRGDLVRSVEETLSPDRDSLRPPAERADRLHGAFQALDRALFTALVADAQGQAEDFERLVPILLEMPIAPTDRPADTALTWLTGIVNFVMARYFVPVSIDQKWVRETMLNENGRTAPVVQRLAVIHYALVTPFVQTMTDGDRESLVQLDALFKRTVTGVEKVGDLGKALEAYFGAMDEFGARLPGVRRSGAASVHAEFDRRMTALAQQMEVNTPTRPDLVGSHLTARAKFFTQNLRDPKAVEGLNRAAGAAFAQLAVQWKEALGASSRDAFAQGVERPRFEAAAGLSTEDWVQAVRAQHRGLLTVLSRASAESPRGERLDPERFFSGVRTEQEFIERLGGYVESLQRDLRAEAARVGSPYATGADRTLDGLVKELRDAAVKAKNGVADRESERTAGVLSSGSPLLFLVNLFTGQQRVNLERAYQSQNLSLRMSETLNAIFDHCEKVVGSFSQDLMNNLAGGRPFAYFKSDPVAEVGGALHRFGRDQVRLLSLLKWQVIQNGSQHGLAGAAGGDKAAAFDQLIVELNQLSEREVRAGGASDVAAAQARTLDFAASMENIWNRAFALAPVATRETAVRARWVPLLRETLTRDPAQNLRPLDLGLGLSRLSKALVENLRSALAFQPTAAGALGVLLKVPAALLEDTPATRAAFAREVREWSRDLAVLLQNKNPRTPVDRLTAFWDGAESWDAARRSSRLLVFADEIDAALGQIHSTRSSGELRATLERNLGQSADPAALLDRGFLPLTDYVTAALASAPDPNAFRLSVFPSAAQRLFLDGTTPADNVAVGQKVGSDFDFLLALLRSVRGSTGEAPGAADVQRSIAGARTDAELAGALTRAFGWLDRRLSSEAGINHEPNKLVRLYQQAARQSTLGPRAEMGPYRETMKEALKVVEAVFAREQERVTDALGDIGTDPSRENALAVLNAFKLELIRLEQAAPQLGPVSERAAAAMRSALAGAPDVATGLDRALRAGSAVVSGAVRQIESDRSFPAAAIQKSFDRALSAVSRSEGAARTASHARSGLAAAVSELRDAVGRLVAHQAVQRDVLLDGGSPAVFADQLFSGKMGDALLSALRADIPLRHKFLVRDARILYPALRIDPPSMVNLRGASLEGVKTFLLNYGAGVDRGFQRAGVLFYAPGQLSAELERLLRTVEDPLEALDRGATMIDGRAREALAEAQAWNGRRLVFRDLIENSAARLSAASDVTGLRSAALADVRAFLAATALYQNTPPGPAAEGWAQQAFREISTGLPGAESDAWVEELARRLDAFLQRNPVGMPLRSGDLLETVAAARLRVQGAPLEGARHAYARLAFRTQEILENAYQFRVQTFTAGATLTTPLPVGFVARQGFAVQNVGVTEGRHVFVELNDGPPGRGTRVDVGLPDGPGARETLLSFLNKPVILVHRAGEMGREIPGTLFAPKAGAAGPAVPGAVGIYENMTTRLGRASELPGELETIALLRSPEELAAHLKTQGERLADLAYLLSRGNPDVRGQILECVKHYFSLEPARPRSLWDTVASLWRRGDGSQSLRSAMEQNRLGEQVASFYADVLERLKVPVGRAGGTALDFELRQIRQRLAAMSGTVHGGPGDALVAAAHMMAKGNELAANELMAPARSKNDLERSFMDALRAPAQWSDVARVHEAMTVRVFDSVRSVAERHGVPLPADFETTRAQLTAQAVRLRESQDATVAQELLASFQAKTAGLLALFGNEAGAVPVPRVHSVEEATAVYGRLVGDAAATLRRSEGTLTRRDILEGRSSDRVARALTAMDDLPLEQKALLGLLAHGVGGTEKPTLLQRVVSLWGLFWEKIMVFAVERAALRLTVQGLTTLFAGPLALLLWAPTAAYKFLAIPVIARGALPSDEQDRRVADLVRRHPEVVVSDAPFATGVRQSLLATVEILPGLPGSPAIEKTVVRSGFTRLSTGRQDILLRFARWERALEDSSMLGRPVVHLLRVLDFNQVLMAPLLAWTRLPTFAAPPPARAPGEAFRSSARDPGEGSRAPSSVARRFTNAWRSSGRAAIAAAVGIGGTWAVAAALPPLLAAAVVFASVMAWAAFRQSENPSLRGIAQRSLWRSASMVALIAGLSTFAVQARGAVDLPLWNWGGALLTVVLPIYVAAPGVVLWRHLRRAEAQGAVDGNGAARSRSAMARTMRTVGWGGVLGIGLFLAPSPSEATLGVSPGPAPSPVFSISTPGDGVSAWAETLTRFFNDALVPALSAPHPWLWSALGVGVLFVSPVRALWEQKVRSAADQERGPGKAGSPAIRFSLGVAALALSTPLAAALGLQLSAAAAALPVVGVPLVTLLALRYIGSRPATAVRLEPVAEQRIFERVVDFLVHRPKLFEGLKMASFPVNTVSAFGGLVAAIELFRQAAGLVFDPLWYGLAMGLLFLKVAMSEFFGLISDDVTATKTAKKVENALGESGERAAETRPAESPMEFGNPRSSLEALRRLGLSTVDVTEDRWRSPSASVEDLLRLYDGIDDHRVRQFIAQGVIRVLSEQPLSNRYTEALDRHAARLGEPALLKAQRAVENARLPRKHQPNLGYKERLLQEVVLTAFALTLAQGESTREKARNAGQAPPALPVEIYNTAFLLGLVQKGENLQKIADALSEVWATPVDSMTLKSLFGQGAVFQTALLKRAGVVSPSSEKGADAPGPLGVVRVDELMPTNWDNTPRGQLVRKGLDERIKTHAARMESGHGLADFVIVNRTNLPEDVRGHETREIEFVRRTLQSRLRLSTLPGHEEYLRSVRVMILDGPRVRPEVILHRVRQDFHVLHPRFNLFTADADVVEFNPFARDESPFRILLMENLGGEIQWVDVAALVREAFLTARVVGSKA